MNTARALSGRRVLELADEKGVYCGKLLADMGADVIKIEPPGGDPIRALAPFLYDRPGPDRSLFFLYTNTSKRGITLDISRPEAYPLFVRLAQTADLIVETFEPGYLDGLGLGYQTLKGLNPRLVFTSITPFGQSGPFKHFRSSNLVASAMSGTMYVTGEAEDPPVLLAGSQPSMVASTTAAASSMIALYRSTLSGTGQQVDISVQEATIAAANICGVGKWLDDHIIPRRRGTGLFAAVPSGCYPCKDGAVYIIVNRPLHWQGLAQWIHEITGNTVVLDPMFEGPSSNRQPNRDLLDLYISELSTRYTVDEMYHEGQRRHLAVTPVSTAARVAADPHLAARHFFVPVADGEGGTVPYPGAPYRLAVTPWAITRPAPKVGEHNADIYCGELGLSGEEFRSLGLRGII